MLQYCQNNCPIEGGQNCMTTITMKPHILYDHIFMIYPECADNM